MYDSSTAFRSEVPAVLSRPVYRELLIGGTRRVMTTTPAAGLQRRRERRAPLRPSGCTQPSRCRTAETRPLRTRGGQAPRPPPRGRRDCSSERCLCIRRGPATTVPRPRHDTRRPRPRRQTVQPPNRRQSVVRVDQPPASRREDRGPKWPNTEPFGHGTKHTAKGQIRIGQ